MTTACPRAPRVKKKTTLWSSRQRQEKKKQTWNDCNWVRLECRACTASIVYYFCSENRLSKILFFKSFSKKRSDCKSQKSGLDLIRRIHPECWFYGFMIRFWICPPKRKIRFWIRKFGFGFSPQKGPIYVKACYSHDNSLGQAVPGGVMVK